MNLKPHFSRFLQSDPDRLHFAAHSHHPWPDVSFEAQKRCWLDAARLAQLPPGGTVHFAPVSPHGAHNALHLANSFARRQTLLERRP